MSIDIVSQKETAQGGIVPNKFAPHRASGGLVRSSIALSRMELLNFFRDRRSLVFVLLFPVLLLVIFAAIFTGTIEGEGVQVPLKQLFMAGITAAGVMSCAFQGLSINIVQERESGLIRRFARSPMPKAAYFIAKMVRVLVTTVVEVAILLAISIGFYGLPLPSSGQAWLTLAWVIPLGAAACALMGMAYAALIPSANSAAAIVTPVFMALQFISGVFLPFSAVPGWMQTIGSFFPLRWLAQGLRSVFLPEQLAVTEVAGSYELDRVALWLGVWVVAGLILTSMTFKWKGPKVK